jgi:predicted molibdopterin-dependent oxidoreductase YjgC
MVKMTVDGQQFEADPKQTVIQAAQEHGIHIPHFAGTRSLLSPGIAASVSSRSKKCRN